MATSLSCCADFVLGMDLGTTSVKVVLLDAHSKTVTDCISFPTNSDISCTPDKHVSNCSVKHEFQRQKATKHNNI